MYCVLRSVPKVCRSTGVLLRCSSVNAGAHFCTSAPPTSPTTTTTNDQQQPTTTTNEQPLPTTTTDGQRTFTLNKMSDEGGRWTKGIKGIKWRKDLTKFRLTCFVSGTAFTGYVINPATSLSWTSFGQSLCVFGGTFLCAAAANTINQVREIPYDSQMGKLDRPLVSGRITIPQAFTHGLLCGVSGVTLLCTTTTYTTAFLGLANIVLYGWLYTSLKRTSVSNTAVGAVVGAIPPVMGWCAGVGMMDVIQNSPGVEWESFGWMLYPAFLFSWQLSHFHALSLMKRESYARAGYAMMAVLYPDSARKVALLHASSQLLLTIPLYYMIAPTALFALPAVAVNSWLLYLAFMLWLKPSRSPSPLFLASLVNLPVVSFALMLGVWYAPI